MQLISFNLVNFVVSVSKWNQSFQNQQVGRREKEKGSKTVFIILGFFLLFVVSFTVCITMHTLHVGVKELVLEIR